MVVGSIQQSQSITGVVTQCDDMAVVGRRGGHEGSYTVGGGGGLGWVVGPGVSVVGEAFSYTTDLRCMVLRGVA